MAITRRRSSSRGVSGSSKEGTSSSTSSEGRGGGPTGPSVLACMALWAVCGLKAVVVDGLVPSIGAVGQRGTRRLASAAATAHLPRNARVPTPAFAACSASSPPPSSPSSSSSLSASSSRPILDSFGRPRNFSPSFHRAFSSRGGASATVPNASSEAMAGSSVPSTLTAEEDVSSSSSSSSSSGISESVSALRAWMEEEGVVAFIVPSDDPHLSEYAAPHYNRREFISGFTGSAGTVVITKSAALLWTDGRYFLQAGQELQSDWTLMKSGQKGTPTIKDYLCSELSAGDEVAVDPFVLSATFATQLRDGLREKSINMKKYETNPLDAVWGEARPSAPQSQVRVHPLQFAGQSVADKLKSLRGSMAEEKAEAFVVCMLDEVAYLLNVRGSDVAHNPVTVAYAVVTEGEANLFIDQAKVGEEVRAHLSEPGVTVADYTEALPYVKRLVKEGKSVWVDPARVNFAFYDAVVGGGGQGEGKGGKDGTAEASAVQKVSPITLAKGVKNDTELKSMREVHIRDGTAMARFLSWLQRDVGEQGKSYTEVEVDAHLREYRKAEGMMEESFPTIAGAGANGAIIHYDAQPETAATLDNSVMFLLDSGGQYEDGTTDVTRTMHFGTPTDFQKEAYTRVLKGHIGLSTAVFPDGTPGCQIDAFARRALWAAGLDYGHGTGHGVGAALNVHEGPHSISPRFGNLSPMEKGMIVSNEPGFYQPGEFGIRIENLLEIVDTGMTNKVLNKSFFTFEDLTLIPIQQSLIDTSLLTTAEMDWLDAYHRTVWEKISPRLGGEEDKLALQWLKEATGPMKR